MPSRRIEDALQLLRAEYLDTPDLALTPSQVAGLVDLDPPTAEIVLQALADSCFLMRTSDGRFVHRRMMN